MSLIEIINKHKYNGQIYVRRGNNILCNQGFGYKDIAAKIPNTTSTINRIASITKQFTAYAILQLVDEGKLELHQTIESIYPDYRYASQITIHHLLTNTSGIPSYPIDGDYEFLNDKTPYYHHFLREIIYPYELAFTPGEKWDYSGSSYIFLTDIIEKISGLSFHDYIVHHICHPLGMFQTGQEDPRRALSDMATAYDVQDGQIIPARTLNMLIAGGGGGCYSSVHDLHLWNQNLLHSTLLPKNVVDQLFTNYIQIIETTGYGYGWFVALDPEFDPPKLDVYHTGGGPGARTINRIYPNDDAELIMISNVNDSAQFNKLLGEIEAYMFQS